MTTQISETFLTYVGFDLVFTELPDEITLAFMLSNCPNKCEGCHSPHLRENIGQTLTTSVIDSIILTQENILTAICFMGGDINPQLIDYFAEYVKKMYGLKVGWYSGKDEIPDSINLDNFDFIKIGSYKKELGGLSSPTTNQKLYKVKNNKLIDITYKLQKNGNKN